MLQFDYDNGFGERVGRFKIDLYKAQDGAGDCGLWVTSICDKPERGCHDSREFLFFFIETMYFSKLQSPTTLTILLVNNPQTLTLYHIPTYVYLTLSLIM